MENDLRELRVFMASPGDLGDERDALRDLERRLNAMFRQRRVRVSIEGWEEVQPDAGPPQELINPLVHECHVFIGLLNMRWGTPTDNDSSGFSEEFNIALARRAKGDAPVIGMFFREIEPDRLRDRGPQLQAVLAFKERVLSERLLLFKEFKNADQLALEIMNFLVPQVFRLADETAVGGTVQGGDSSGSTATKTEPTSLESAEIKGEEAETDGLDPAQRQVVSALMSFANAFSSATPLDPGARDRVTLTAAAFAQDDGTLGTHHANRLFSRRDELELTVGEINIWYRTFFENYGTEERDYRTIPMWGVVDTGRLGARFIADLGSLASDEHPAVVRGVLRFMTEHQIRPESFWEPINPDIDGDGASFESRAPGNVVTRWIKLFEKMPGVDSALNYVVAVARTHDAELLFAVSESNDLDERTGGLIRVVVDILNGDTSSVVDLAPTRYSGEDTSALRDLVVRSVPNLSVEQWDALLTGSHRQIAVTAARQIVEHEPVTAGQLKAIVELMSPSVDDAIVDRASRDAAWAVRQIGELNELDKHRWAQLVSRLMASAVPRDALEGLHRDEELSATAWVALTIQDPSGYVESAREVLDGTAEWLIQRNEPLMENYAAIAHYTASVAKGAACVVLSRAELITDDDVHRVCDELRRDHYISRPSALRALVTMVARLDADPDRTLPDLGDLSALDRYGYADDIDVVLDSPLAKFVVPVWRDSDTQALRAASRAWELRQPEVTEEELEEALYLDDQELRMVAVDELLARWTDERAGALLNRYDNQGRPYWYNVIAALDDRLYGYSRASTCTAK